MQRWTIDFNGSSYSRDCRKCYKILYLLSFCHYSSSRWMYFFFVFIRIACLFSFQLLEFLLYIYLHVSMWRFFFSFVSFVPNDWCYVHGSEALTRSYIFASHMCALHACMCTFQSAKSFYANSTSWVYSSAIPPLFFFYFFCFFYRATDCESDFSLHQFLFLFHAFPFFARNSLFA